MSHKPFDSNRVLFLIFGGIVVGTLTGIVFGLIFMSLQGY